MFKSVPSDKSMVQKESELEQLPTGYKASLVEVHENKRVTNIVAP